MKAVNSVKSNTSLALSTNAVVQEIPAAQALLLFVKLSHSLMNELAGTELFLF
jgi:hypothetical protein